MSKRRDLRNRTNGSINNMSLDDRKLRNSSIFGTETIKSKYIPVSKHHMSDATVDLLQNKKDKMFNRNISFFRQSFNQNDPSQLPFMSSLRSIQKIKSSEMKNMSTICKPFEAGQKSTSNMKIKKRVPDLSGKGIRMTNAYYRWHNKSGVNNKQSTVFECTLRDYNESWAPNPEQQRYDNNSLVRPINYKDVETPKYQLNSLICARQKKLFMVN